VSNVTARSLIFRIYKNYTAISSATQAGIRRLELSLASERIAFPGTAFGGLQAAGADNFTSATELTGGAGASELDNTGFTTETNEPDHAESGTTATAWYKWVAPSSGTVFFDTKNSAIDTVLAVYLGDTLLGLSLVVENDDQELGGGISGAWSALNFEATQGVEYKIVVGGYGSEEGTARLNWAMLDAYASVPGQTVDITPFSAFLPYGPKTGNLNINNAWISDFDIFSPTTGDKVGGGYIQLVVVLPQDIEFDEVILNNFHSAGADISRGVREAQIYVTDYPVTQIIAEDDSVPIAGEILVFDSRLGQTAGDISAHSAVDEVDEYSLDVNFSETAALVAGFSLGFLTGGESETNEAKLEGGLDLDISLKATQSLPNSVSCGLSLAANMTAAAEHKPAALLAALGLGMTGEITQPNAARLKGKLCLSCMLRADTVPGNVLNAAMKLDVKMVGASEQAGKLKVGIALGSVITAQTGTPPCLSPEFNRGDWF